MFPCELCESFKSTFFKGTSPVAASVEVYLGPCKTYFIDLLTAKLFSQKNSTIDVVRCAICYHLYDF